MQFHVEDDEKYNEPYRRRGIMSPRSLVETMLRLTDEEFGDSSIEHKMKEYLQFTASELASLSKFVNTGRYDEGIAYRETDMLY